MPSNVDLTTTTTTILLLLLLLPPRRSGRATQNCTWPVSTWTEWTELSDVVRSTRLTVGRARDVKSDKLFTACRNILTLFWSPTCLRISHSTPEHSASEPLCPFPPQKKSGSRRTSSVLPARTLLTLVNIGCMCAAGVKAGMSPLPGGR